jgi:glycosyltransferase involved in cell wall biosynthesis
MALITIITVVFNGESVLEDTIKSVISAKHESLKYVIIDGGSGDGTVEIIKRYSSFLSFWISEPDNGIYDAMNKGWKFADKNSYILYLGAGDQLISLPNNLDEGYSKIYFGDVLIGNRVFSSVSNVKLKMGNTLHHQALLIPKAINEEAPFNTNYRVYADFDFNQRLFKRKVEFKYCSDFKAYALPGGISGKRENGEMLRVVRKNFGITVQALAFLFYRLQRIKSYLNNL